MFASMSLARLANPVSMSLTRFPPSNARSRYFVVVE
jgi:hypothetical protein